MGLVPLGAAAAVEALEAEGQNEMEVLLEKLKVEPEDAEEVAAMFGLFEKYLETVEKMRVELFEFWKEAHVDFHETGRADVERMLKKIDSQDNMGVEFVPHRWFVYDMCRKAGQNSALIGRNLGMIKARLELLSAQDDCPICLEPMSADGVEPHTLGC